MTEDDMNAKCKLLGHDVQPMTPPGVDNEIWGCANRGCNFELYWEETPEQYITWLGAAVKWCVRFSNTPGRYITNLFKSPIEEDDIPF